MFGVLRKKESLLLRMDRLGEVLEVAHAAVQLSGLDPAVLVGGLVYDFVEQVFEQPQADEIINRIADALSQGHECELARGTAVLEGERLIFRPTPERPGSFDLLLVGSGIDRALSHLRESGTQVAFQGQGFVERTRLYIVRTDPNFRITEVYGDVEGLTGISSDQMFFGFNIWAKIMRTREARRLLSHLRSQLHAREVVEEEIQVTNQKTGERKWLLIKALPLFGKDGDHLGWEAIGIDSTDKKEAELSLVAQGRRLEALYEVARRLDLNQDTSKVALQGLLALLEALPAASFGLILLGRSRSQSLELSAASGIAEDDLELFENSVGHSVFLREVRESGQLLYIPDLRARPEIKRQLSGLAVAHSLVVAPMSVEGATQSHGLLVLASRRRDRFSELDLDLIQAVTRQLGLVISQAEYYAAERQQVSSLGALYQLSHELSQVFSTKDIAEYAFPIIQEQLPCRRGWFGVINENATHIIGEGGFGPGLRTRLINIQIELNLRHDFFDEAIRTKQAVIVPAGTSMECSGLNRIIARLQVGTLVIIPLVSLGKVVGVLVLEPEISGPEFLRGRLPLLSSMASEIASVVYARKFESKVADAQKMRMAGLLASGMAHNFNNLLQAILGQAQLLELELANSPRLREPVKTIVSAGTQGARLLRQLINLTDVNDFQIENISLDRFVDESFEFYRSLLPENVKFEIRLPKEPLPAIKANQNQIQQVLSNLVLNARDAVETVPEPEVTIQATIVQLATGEIDPELAPGRYVRIDVEDNGIGMTSDQIARCFEPFYTTKNWDATSGVGVSGSGLGLSISYSIMKRLGGILTVSSRPGDGATFSLYLAVAEGLSERVSSLNDEKQDIAQSFSVKGEKSLGSSIVEKVIDSEPTSEKKFLLSDRGTRTSTPAGVRTSSKPES